MSGLFHVSLPLFTPFATRSLILITDSMIELHHHDLRRVGLSRRPFVCPDRTKRLPAVKSPAMEKVPMALDIEQINFRVIDIRISE